MCKKLKSSLPFDSLIFYYFLFRVLKLVSLLNVFFHLFFLFNGFCLFYVMIINISTFIIHSQMNIFFQFFSVIYQIFFLGGFCSCMFLIWFDSYTQMLENCCSFPFLFFSVISFFILGKFTVLIVTICWAFCFCFFYCVFSAF